MAANTVNQSLTPKEAEEHWVLRYLPAQRLVHWLGAAGFVILLCQEHGRRHERLESGEPAHRKGNELANHPEQLVWGCSPP